MKPLPAQAKPLRLRRSICACYWTRRFRRLSRPLTVEELLVVTFTEAATAELRGRIRSNIHELRIACLRETTDNPLYERLLEEIDDKAQAAQWSSLAERQMDEAAVFTIHGFCQRMLNLNAFESGMLFEQQLIEDESLLRYQACADFWRRHCYPLPREIALVVFENLERAAGVAARY